MAKIRERRVVQGVIDSLKLQRQMEKVPEEITSKVVPTYDIREKGKLKLIFDNTSNDSSKLFIPPKGVRWEIQLIHVLLVTTATVGNRRIAVELLDASGGTQYWRSDGDFAHAASTTFYYNFSPNITTSDNNTGSMSFVFCPKDVFNQFQLRIRDRLGVAPAADDMNVTLIVKEFSDTSGD